ncbi:DUF7342 family protein [Halococcus hamelinensis]|uniref:DUF7342 family protein n=1 Tax=Halococcus hamelinensis TaxID=332168 RepID=UPI0012678065|nr:ArsR family transcriptional regulator [Halococcus hamelinensis]
MVTQEEELRGTEQWEAKTEGFDRILSVALTLEKPRPVSWISEEARVSENTARKYLERFHEMDALTVAEQGATTYYPNSAYLRFRDVSHVATELDREELEKRVTSLSEKSEAIGEMYEASGPGQLRERVTDEDISTDELRKLREAASEWESLDYRLSISREALERYDQHNMSHRQQVV